MTSLPPPPDPVEPETWFPRRPARAGELTPAWRVVFGLGWVGVILAFAAVWKSGRTLGLSPWWLGPSGDPHLLFVNLIPFVPSVAVVLLAMRNVRYLPWVGIAASLALAGVATGDLDRFNGIAAVEFAAAGAAVLISAAAFAGMHRSGDPAAVDEQHDALIDALRPPVTQ